MHRLESGHNCGRRNAKCHRKVASEEKISLHLGDLVNLLGRR